MAVSPPPATTAPLHTSLPPRDLLLSGPVHRQQLLPGLFPASASKIAKIVQTGSEGREGGPWGVGILVWSCFPRGWGYQKGREEPTPTQLEGFTQPPCVQAVSQGRGILTAILSPLQNPALLQGARTIYKLLQDYRTSRCARGQALFPLWSFPGSPVA